MYITRRRSVGYLFESKMLESRVEHKYRQRNHTHTRSHEHTHIGKNQFMTNWKRKLT